MKNTKRTYILISFFIVIIFIIIVSTFFFTTNLIERKQNENLLFQRNNTKLEVEYYFQKIENTLSNLELFILEENYSDEELLDYMIAIANESELFYSIYLGKPDKTMINSSGFIPGSDFDLRTRPWYEMALENDGFIYTPGYLNATKDKIIINVAKAIYLDNQLVGVLSTDIDISSISNIVTNTEVGNDGFAFIIDSDNHVVAYHNLDFDNLSLIELPIENFDLDSFASEGFTESVIINDTDGVLAYDLIASDHYVLGVFLPMNEYSSPIILVRQVFIISFAIFAMSSLIILVLYYKHIDEPFRDVIDSILKIDVNTNPKYRIDPSNKRDYKPIINALNKTLDSTESHINNNLESQQQLIIENQRVKLLMESTADIIFEIDMDKRFVSVFGKGIQKLNLSSQDFIGRTVKDVFGNDGIERDQVYTYALQGEHTIYDWQFSNKNKTLYFESSISPIYNKENQIVGAVGISREITEAMEKQKEIEYISNHDFLTGLFNRRYFVDKFSSLDSNLSYPLGLMMLDLNGLKLLNDAYGHVNGDQALKKTAEIIKLYSPQNATVARIGGDEFAIIIPKSTDTLLKTIKINIQSNLSKVKIHNIPLSIAIGYDTCESNDDDLEKLMKSAEHLMYMNKAREGRKIRNNSIKAIYDVFIEKNDHEKRHSMMVSKLSLLIGKDLNIKEDDLKELELAGLYHDIGKITIPDAIINKKVKLTKEENILMKKHTENGYNILRAADYYSNLATYALSHHENWDGTGYPQGLKGEAIPLFSRIIAIANSFASMIEERPRQSAISKDKALNYIIDNAGKKFDPNIVKIFIEIIKNKKIS
ncbi:diguanylate cyclase [Mycoplasmatota bacterium]|nr:diguanylate cyclase [Mycoplasmatota bacterium]